MTVFTLDYEAFWCLSAHADDSAASTLSPEGRAAILAAEGRRTGDVTDRRYRFEVPAAGAVELRDWLLRAAERPPRPGRAPDVLRARACQRAAGAIDRALHQASRSR